jgi:hypothetical protein
MKVRAAILVLALLPVGAATTALGATKPKPKPLPKVCNLIVDDAGDEKYNGAVPGDGNDDIVSGDLSSNGKVITGVLRLAALAQPDPMSPLGEGYFLEFSAKGADNTLFLSARTYPTGTKYVFGYSAADPTSGINTSYTIGTATGSVDTAKKEVHITAPNAGFAPAGTKLTLGTKLLGPAATSYRIVGQAVVPSQSVGGQRVPIGGLLLPFDTASSSKSYVVGQASCVTPGK